MDIQQVIWYGRPMPKAGSQGQGVRSWRPTPHLCSPQESARAVRGP